MINTVLELVTTSLNRYLKIRLDFSEHMVVLSSLVEPDGTMVPETDNKLVISLVSVERVVMHRYPKKSLIFFQSISGRASGIWLLDKFNPMK